MYLVVEPGAIWRMNFRNFSKLKLPDKRPRSTEFVFPPSPMDSETIPKQPDSLPLENALQLLSFDCSPHNFKSQIHNPCTYPSPASGSRVKAQPICLYASSTKMS